MRLTSENRADQRLTGRVEQHGMAGLSDLDLGNHCEQTVEAIGGDHGADHVLLPVVQNWHRDIQCFIGCSEGSFLWGNEPAQKHTFIACANGFPPRLISKIIPVRLRARRDERTVLVHNQEADDLVAVADLGL